MQHLVSRSARRALIFAVALATLQIGLPPAGAATPRGTEPDADATTVAYTWGGNGASPSPPYGYPSLHFTPTPARVLFPRGVRIAAVAGGGSDGVRQPTRAHSLALAADGTVWQWGGVRPPVYGRDEQPTTPELVRGLADVTAIAAGASYSLALGRDGIIRFWRADSPPTVVEGLTSVTAIAAGGVGSLALRDDGTVWRDLLRAAGPTQVIGLSDIVAIAAGGRGVSFYSLDYSAHGLALRRDGTVWSWGDNSLGQLGNGTFSESRDPAPRAAQVGGLADIVAIAAGEEHSLALGRDGAVRAWGANRFGQLGATTSGTCWGGAACSVRPVRAGGAGEVRAIAAGSEHTLALRRDGTLLAWGWNAHGQLGRGGADEDPHPLPTALPAPSGVRAIAAGHAHNLVVRDDGSLWAWGLNDDGEVGIGVSKWQPLPTPAALPDDVRPVQVAAGAYFSLALADDGRAWAWGDNRHGQLGDGTQESRAAPAPVRGLAEVRSLSAGLHHSLALRRDGSVWSWGKGQLLPVRADTPGGMIAVAAGAYHDLALRADGTVWAWGSNRNGELGDGTVETRPTPVPVSGLTGVVAIAAGFDISAALTGDGTLWTWGDSTTNGQGPPRRAAPRRVDGPTGVTAIAAGTSYALAASGDGEVWSVARDGAATRVAGLTEVVAVAAATNYGPAGNLALRRDGTVWSWSYAANQPERAIPTPVRGLTGIAAISAGADRSMALGENRRCFAATGFCAQGPLLEHWRARGGLAIFGYPLTPERDETLEDGRSHRVQWFERARLELHPENAPPHDILLGQFGRAIGSATAPVAPRDGYRFFAETGHNVSPRFARYWEEGGGLALFGYPLDEETVEVLADGKPRTVQYFERARFELHPENAAPYDVLLGQFGRQLLDERPGGR